MNFNNNTEIYAVERRFIEWRFLTVLILNRLVVTFHILPVFELTNQMMNSFFPCDVIDPRYCKQQLKELTTCK